MSKSSHPSTKQLREFGILLGVVFPVVFGWLIPALKGHHAPIWPFCIGLPSLALAFIAPRSLQLPYQGWMKIGYVLGWVNSNLILGMVFLFVLQPIAYLLRLIGYDPLRRKRNSLESYREQNQRTTIDFTRIF